MSEDSIILGNEVIIFWFLLYLSQWNYEETHNKRFLFLYRSHFVNVLFLLRFQRVLKSKSMHPSFSPHSIHLQYNYLATVFPAVFWILNSPFPDSTLSFSVRCNSCLTINEFSGPVAILLIRGGRTLEPAIISSCPLDHDIYWPALALLSDR